MAAQNLTLGAFLTEKCSFPGFGPPVGDEKCAERAKPLKTESPITHPSKILHTSSSLYFWASK